MWILVLKGLKQATARVYLGLSIMNCQELFPAQLPHPSLDGILVHHSIVPNGM